MKIKNLVLSMTLALGAVAAQFTGRADVAAGDIYSIDLVEGGVYGGKIPTEDSPLIAGESQKAVIRVRLLNRNYAAAGLDPAMDTVKKWRFMPLVPWGEMDPAKGFFAPQLGLMLGGEKRFADYVGQQDVTLAGKTQATYTDIYFAYVPKAGDLAMPALFMNSAGTPASSEVSVDYFINNSAYWQLTCDDGSPCNFHFGPESLTPDPDPSAEFHNRCINGSGLGLYIKTVDLDSNYDVPPETIGAEGVWRQIHRGATTTAKANGLPAVMVAGGAPAEASTTVYVWVPADELDIASPLTTEATEVHDVYRRVPKGEEIRETRWVLTVTIPKDNTSCPFRIRGVKNGTAHVRMSSSPDLLLDDAGVLIPNWVERTIEVVDPPAPYVSFEMQDPAGKPLVAPVNCTDDYKNYVAKLVVTLSQAPTNKVTVGLNPEINGGDDIFGDMLLGISLTTEGTPWTDEIKSVEFNAGETEKTLFIYAKGASKNLADFGVKFTPSTDDAMFADDDHSHTASLVVKYMTPEILRPTAEDKLEGLMAGQDYTLDITLLDAYKFMRDAYTFKYKVKMNGAGSVSTWETIDSVEIDSDSGESTVDITFEDEGEGVLEIYVLNADKQASKHVNVPIVVAGPKKAWAELDHADGYYAEGETAKVKFLVDPKTPGSKTYYAFLVPMNDDATNKMQSATFSTANPSSGIPLAPGSSDSGSLTAEVQMLDGNANGEFQVFVCTQQNYLKTKSAGYSAGTIILHATNVCPRVVSASMSGLDITTSGGVAPKAVAQDVNKTFRINIGETEPGELDLNGELVTNEVGEVIADNRFATQWKFGTESTDWETVYGNPNLATTATNHAFASPGAQVVKVRVADKDMRKLGKWSPEFTFTVNVLDAPSIKIIPMNGNTYNETDTGDNLSHFDVELSTPAQFASSDDRLDIKLEVIPLGDTSKYSAADCELSKDLIQFRSGVDKGQSFYLKTLDGTAESAASGFRIVATVTPESQAKDTEGKKWDAGEVEISVVNVKPEILTPAEMFDTEGKPIAQTTTVGTKNNLAWALKDVVADKEGMTVTWTTSEGESQTYKQGAGYDDVMSGTHTFSFNSAGEKSVTIMVQDKDGGVDSRTLYYTIASSKTLEMVPHGPPGGNGTALSSKYQDKASGLGAGKVWADNLAQIKNWVFIYNCGLGTTWRIYAEGYKPGEVDTTVSSSGTEGGGYKYTDSLNRESFMYAWLQIVQEEDSAKPTDEYLAVVPEHRGAPNSGTLVNLPTEKDDDDNYAATCVEAIFSKEWLPSDNMGDINQDGVPDIYVKKYEFGVFDETGALAGDDLKKITVANENGNIDMDFLPSVGTSVYGTLIPGLAESWAVAGREFGAVTEIRGYHNGLNNAPQQVGIDVKSDLIYAEDVEGVMQWTENCTISYVEFLAWKEWATANLGENAWSVKENWTKWSPERPTDPCEKDTDDDGFDDGYEYYFWYKAHVGELDANGTHRYLTGRAYDPRNPGEGKFLSSAYIARLMDPRSDLPAVDFPEEIIDPGNADTRDSDNDGLPDLLEFLIGTNPIDFDTDGDGLPDGWEIMIAGLDPTTASSSADALMDTERNYDGDAMAIGSFKLEAQVQPPALNVEHARRWTFAAIKADGDTDGVQWYAMKRRPEIEVLSTLASEDWWKVTVNGVVYCVISKDKPVVVDGYLAASISKNVFTLVEYTPPATTNKIGEEEGGGEEPPAAEKVRGYPVRLAGGSPATVEAGDGELKIYGLAEKVAEKDANACWIYGKGKANALIGEVAETAAEYGCLALGRYEAIEPEDLKPVVICAVPDMNRDVAFLHYLCYQEFGFDPRTAWRSKDPLAARWGKTVGGDAVEGITVMTQGGYTGHPTRTRDYAAYDEFLVYSFFLNNGVDMSGVTYVFPDAPMWAQIWGAFTTNPQGPNEPDLINGDNYWGRNSDQGADTDLDGVPDGWELYVMAGPKRRAGDYVFAPPYTGFATALNPETAMPKSFFSPFVPSAQSTDTSNQIYLGGQANDDGLNQFREFGGTDTIAHYADYSETIVRDPADANWINKFFPTDPWAVDTDGDGVGDGAEGQHFVYGTPADDGSRWSLPGGGLNPCSVDTDRDGLPDGWEAQFKGRASSLYAGEDADYAKDASGNPIGNALQGLTDGMDGTVADAVSYPSTVSVGGAKQVVNRDYDHDGLENWQEYLTGTMRCWRYDDPVSPLTYIPSDLYFSADEDGNLVFDMDHIIETLQAEGLISEDSADPEGEFWYKTLVDASSEIFNPHLVTDTSSGAQYFTRLKNGWDPAYWDNNLSGSHASGAYYWFYNRVDDTSYVDSWKKAWEAMLETAEMSNSDAQICYVPNRYASCSPIDPDSDRDGMDDYYEVFHGMNPLLGQSGAKAVWVSESGSGQIAESTGGLDLIYDSLHSSGKCVPEAWGTSDDESSFKNFWQWKLEAEGWMPRGSSFDFEAFPWLNGLAAADPDGDGTLSQEESIMGKTSPLTAWHHSDPTPLWMTDSSYTNSLTRMFYRMPVRSTEIDLTTTVKNAFGEDVPGFTYKTVSGEETVEKTYYFSQFPGFLSEKGLAGVRNYFGQFSPDNWGVATTEDASNFIASFEENEGFDTDHDGLNDQDEVSGKFRGQSDPADCDSPRRRQAMYFQGEAKPSVLQTLPTLKEDHPILGRIYPDDMSFLHYTVECWVKADVLADATIIERTSWVGESNPGDKEFMRCNFQVGVKDGKWYTKYDPNDTTMLSVEAYSDVLATTNWTHLAATYDGSHLNLYVNGEKHGSQASGLQPAYGSSAAWVRGPWSADKGFGQTYFRDEEYQLNAILIGAGVKTCAEGAVDGGVLDVTRGLGWDGYTRFFKGYVDEVRIWDGARSAAEISNDRKTRYTAAEAAKNREDFYAVWSQGSASDTYRGRYAKDENGEAYAVPAELRYHWSFDSLFGALNEDQVAKAPCGFDLGAETAAPGRAALSRPKDYSIAWWKRIVDGYEGTVYNHPAWIEWVPNTMAHLPRFDGTTLDSFYWSADFQGATAGTYTFARAAEPVSKWTQYARNGLASSALGYKTTSTRHYLANATDDANGTSFGRLYEFTARHLNQSGDDLLPLGGAFVKQSDTMWDNQGASSNWEITRATADSTDGIPAWWADYARTEYRAELEDGEDMTWNTFVTWPEENGSRMIAGEAYLRDLARGYVYDGNGEDFDPSRLELDRFAQRYDMGANGLPDWWEEMYGLKGVDPLADSDNDGLPNYVEYLLSEVFSFQGIRFDPTNPRSADPYTPDYFFKVGELYAGEIFTDHDLVDDAWEDIYSDSFASRLIWDADADADSDGWSNRSENRYAKQSLPTQADKQTHTSVADGLVADYPIPTIELTLNYNGAQVNTVRTAPIVVQVTRNPLESADPDATFVIDQTDGAQAGSGTSSGNNSEQSSIAHTRTLGRWSNRHVVGTLTPGYINKDSVALEFCFDPDSLVYNWKVWAPLNGTKRGTRTEFDADCRKYGTANVSLISRDTNYKNLTGVELRTAENSSQATWVFTDDAQEIGKIDLITGEFDINLGAFSDVEWQDPSNRTDVVSARDQTYRIAYSVNQAVDLPRKLYLGEATTGYVKEGKNLVSAFFDLDGNGAYTPGEPFGAVGDVDVSWRGTKVAMEVREEGLMGTRVQVFDAKGGSTGGGQGTVQASSDDRTVETLNAPWADKHVIETVTPSAGPVRVRIVRWLVDGTPVWQLFPASPINHVVYDGYMMPGENGTFTERQLLANGDLDLDWKRLKADVADSTVVLMNDCDVTTVDYLVVIGDGPTGWTTAKDTNAVVKALSQVVTRRYGENRTIPVVSSPSVERDQVVRTANPTFKWTIAEPDATAYTAFKVQVANASGAKVFDSGVLPAPARDSKGCYVWSAPLYAGDKTTNGAVYANNAAYSWKVSMYNAKYANDSFSAAGEYLQSVQTNGFSYGTVNVAAKYFGPTNAYAGKIIRVRAFTSPDFTGLPVAAGYVAAPEDAENGVGVTGKEVVANCQLIGIPKGTYYLQAFIDSNNNGVCDSWESMGYLCDRSGATSDWLDPVAVKFGDKVGNGDLAVIYIEDADTDGDSLPDAWEFAKYGSLTKVGVRSAGVTKAGEMIVSEELAGKLEPLAAAGAAGGIAAEILRTINSSKTLAALSLGLDPAELEPEVKTITIKSFAFVDGAVDVTFAADAEAKNIDIQSDWFAFESGDEVSFQVYHTPTLAEKFKPIGDPITITVSAANVGQTVRIDVPDADVKGGFFKVELAK